MILVNWIFVWLLRKSSYPLLSFLLATFWSKMSGIVVFFFIFSLLYLFQVARTIRKKFVMGVGWKRVKQCCWLGFGNQNFEWDSGVCEILLLMVWLFGNVERYFFIYCDFLVVFCLLWLIFFYLIGVQVAMKRDTMVMGENNMKITIFQFQCFFFIFLWFLNCKRKCKVSHYLFFQL